MMIQIKDVENLIHMEFQDLKKFHVTYPVHNTIRIIHNLMLLLFK